MYPIFANLYANDVKLSTNWGSDSRSPIAPPRGNLSFTDWIFDGSALCVSSVLYNNGREKDQKLGPT